LPRFGGSWGVGEDFDPHKAAETVDLIEADHGTSGRQRVVQPFERLRIGEAAP